MAFFLLNGFLGGSSRNSGLTAQFLLTAALVLPFFHLFFQTAGTRFLFRKLRASLLILLQPAAIHIQFVLYINLRTPFLRRTGQSVSDRTLFLPGAFRCSRFFLQFFPMLMILVGFLLIFFQIFFRQASPYHLRQPRMMGGTANGAGIAFCQLPGQQSGLSLTSQLPHIPQLLVSLLPCSPAKLRLFFLLAELLFCPGNFLLQQGNPADRFSFLFQCFHTKPDRFGISSLVPQDFYALLTSLIFRSSALQRLFQGLCLFPAGLFFPAALLRRPNTLCQRIRRTEQTAEMPQLLLTLFLSAFPVLYSAPYFPCLLLVCRSLFSFRVKRL